MRRCMDMGEPSLDIPDAHLRKLGTIGGMMARVAQVDHIVREDELEKMTSIAETGWVTTDWLEIFERGSRFCNQCSDVRSQQEL